jgi:3-deoxy-D-manno-octulosonate 8-phosphate phosphatase KdsC-like HAD superfamily phosphatase
MKLLYVRAEKETHNRLSSPIKPLFPTNEIKYVMPVRGTSPDLSIEILLEDPETSQKFENKINKNQGIKGLEKIEEYNSPVTLRNTHSITDRVQEINFPRMMEGKRNINKAAQRFLFENGSGRKL